MLNSDDNDKFSDVVNKYSEVFDPNFVGYNRAIDQFEASVNICPVQPQQRKGWVPQYSKDKLFELQWKFDQLELSGVFSRPKDVGVLVEYINPLFLVQKSSGG